MDEKLFYIVSDLHLGNAYFHQHAFDNWLQTLPEKATLILNGDVIDDPDLPLSNAHEQTLHRIVAESHQRRVIWVYGNHDADFNMVDSGEIEFVSEWAIEKRLHIVHGNNLDDLMPRHSFFKWVFRRIHHLFVALGLRDMHVAEYAKKWGLIYRVLNERVARNAVRVIEHAGIEAITCGHTHAAMDVERGGKRYINTGAWTERPLHYIRVNTTSIELCVYRGDERSV